jgi:hypothetical protein
LNSESKALLGGPGQNIGTALRIAQTAARVNLAGGKGRQLAGKGEGIFAPFLQAPKGRKGQGRGLGDGLLAGFGTQVAKVAVGMPPHAGQNPQEVLLGIRADYGTVGSELRDSKHGNDLLKWDRPYSGDGRVKTQPPPHAARAETKR